MDEAKSEMSISEALSAIGSKIDNMTVAEIAKETGKSVRGIKTHLTRHGITIKDYDGAEKKANFIKTIETSSPLKMTAALDPSSNYQAMTSIKRDSNRRWIGFGLVFAIIWMGMTFWGFSTSGGGFFLFWLILSLLIATAYGMMVSSVDDAAKKRKVNSLSAADRKAYLQIEKNSSEQQNKIIEEYRHRVSLNGVQHRS